MIRCDPNSVLNYLDFRLISYYNYNRNVRVGELL